MTLTRSTSSTPSTRRTPRGSKTNSSSPARRDATAAGLDSRPPDRARLPPSSSAVALLDARNGKHSFAFSVGSAATADLCTELSSRASNLDENVRVLDRKVSGYAEALRTAEATLQSDQEAHTVTKQQLAELGLTSEADLNVAKDALALERAAHAATKADLHALQASLRASVRLLPSVEA
ncbi:unnamed protein product [Tilletia laevis]|uniref:Uncharacterized protein n=2 Tax=Tilletia TaxID=13289 RepID=A0A177U7Z5_9BASI|nr:hypothetical protein CF336_g4455 [Tilletia laevis]KAE8256626.1 hypothetical protein A4X03_0g5217 [Tilletia caries]CAD6979971.1 unnamed protein product [Tilletia controversa]KAE8195100.1 hypothetical protein CF335_g5174 [Tilletia laevis]CAD6892269.1 unnamed protein product [Tilletia caries]